MHNPSQSKKTILLFLLLLTGFFIFLGVMLAKSVNYRDLPSSYASEHAKAQRGNIISADGFHIASTQKLYKAVVNTKSIDPNKFDLFVNLFSIYSGMNPKSVEKTLRAKRGHVTLSYRISPKTAQQLKALAFELRRLGVFVEYELPSGRSVLYGLSIIESGETRLYPYKNLLTPLVGYPRKTEDEGYTKNLGVKGIEHYYNDELSARQDAYQQAYRDVNSYLILNKASHTKPALDGLDVHLNIPVSLQIRVEQILDRMKEQVQADEIMAVVMESDTGKVRALASSNRFIPDSIRRRDYPSLNNNAVEYIFEPGSVLKPLVFALLLEHKRINPFDLVNGYNGRYKIGRKVITDEHKFDWLSAENVIVHSSNIGMAQLAQNLQASEYYQGLLDFGMTQPSGIDLSYEKRGDMPVLRRFESEIYKATLSYGYGIRTNLIQLLKAYNAFNNHGRVVTPVIVDYLSDERRRHFNIESDAPRQVISAATAARMKQILIKTVDKGTGVKAQTPGVEVGGKTGTAHIADKGRYINEYHTSFIGFANDDTRHYTIGVTVVRPRTIQFASLTAVPTFKAIVDLMIEEDYLTPKPVTP